MASATRLHPIRLLDLHRQNVFIDHFPIARFDAHILPKMIRMNWSLHIPLPFHHQDPCKSPMDYWFFSLLAGYKSRIFLWDVSRPGTSPKATMRTTSSSDASLKGTVDVWCNFRRNHILDHCPQWQYAHCRWGWIDHWLVGTFEGDIAIFDPRCDVSPTSEVHHLFSYDYGNMSALYHVLPEDTNGATGVIQVMIASCLMR